MKQFIISLLVVVLIIGGTIGAGWYYQDEIFSFIDKQLNKKIEDILGDKDFTGPSGENGQDGEIGLTGLSAYQVAVLNGFIGTETEWLASLIGANGLSAYELAVEYGFSGTPSEWLNSLIGAAGTNGTDGSNGLSAYEIAVEYGFTGTAEEWIESLKGLQGAAGENGQDGENGIDGQNGQDGENGIDGQNGLSAYDIACENGFVGSVIDWLNSLKGTNGADGQNGLSAYEIACLYGFVGTEAEWLESLKGVNGTNGVGIQNITFKSTNANGDNVYTITLTNGITYDFVAPKGPQGSQGSQGTPGSNATETKLYCHSIRLDKPDDSFVLFTIINNSSSLLTTMETLHAAILKYTPSGMGSSEYLSATGFLFLNKEYCSPICGIQVSQMVGNTSFSVLSVNSITGAISGSQINLSQYTIIDKVVSLN